MTVGCRKACLVSLTPHRPTFHLKQAIQDAKDFFAEDKQFQDIPWHLLTEQHVNYWVKGRVPPEDRDPLLQGPGRPPALKPETEEKVRPYS